MLCPSKTQKDEKCIKIGWKYKKFKFVNPFYGCVHSGPLVLRTASLKSPTPTVDRDQTSEWKDHRSTDKRYAGDNRLIPPKSSHRRRCLAPRCRLITSWGWSRSQGYGCSPFKVVRELGSERRETVRSLSAVGVWDLREAAPSTRGPEWTNHWCSGCHANGIAR
jgi:hypothetical protein